MRSMTSVSFGRYRRKREKLVDLAAAAPIPTTWGPFKAYCFKSVLDGIEHIAMVKVSKVVIRGLNKLTSFIFYVDISLFR